MRKMCVVQDNVSFPSVIGVTIVESMALTFTLRITSDVILVVLLGFLTPKDFRN